MQGVDEVELGERATSAAQSWAPGCTIDQVEPMEGGTVSLVYRAAVTNGPPEHPTTVLKVAPPGLPPVRNRDVLRQARCMAALGGRPGVGVPEVLFTDPGQPDDVPPFVATSFVEGECAEPLLEARDNPMPEKIVRGRAFDAVKMLVALHRLEPGQIGLADEPVTTLEDEVMRWTRALDTVADEFRLGYEACAEALHRSEPAATGPVVIHGDYRLGNMLAEGPSVRAIIDWEIWSISDPRIDLSWFLFFTEEAGHPVAPDAHGSGMPSDTELLVAYEGSVGTPVVDLEWFHALTRYKEAAAMALIAKHMLRRDPESEHAAGMARVCTTLIAEAHERVGG